MKLRITFFTCLIFSLVLQGCGGGSSSNPTSISSNSVTGVVFDGPIAGAKIGFDLNFNDSLEPSEVLTTSDSNGFYKLLINSHASNFPMLATSGFDTLLNKPFEGVLSAPSPTPGVTQVISPLTTLLAKGASKDSIHNMLNLTRSLDINVANPKDNIELLKAGIRLHVLSTHISKASSKPIIKSYESLASLTSISDFTIKSVVESLSETKSRGIERLIHESFKSFEATTHQTELLQLQSLNLSTVSSAITRFSSSTVEVTSGLSQLLADINNRKSSVMNSIGITMNFITSGTFKMWEAFGDVPRSRGPYPGTTVTLTKGFYIGITEITQAQWERVVGENTWPGGFLPGPVNGDNYPIYDVSWLDAQVFIKKLNELEGTDAYRLPTEAEWEYSTRAGTVTSYYTGADPSAVTSYEWFQENSNSQLHPVAQKLPNPWGLYDTYSNVAEWTNDWYTYTIPTEPLVDPIGPPFSGHAKIFKGYQYDVPLHTLSHEHRRSGSPGARFFSTYIGFRIVREIK